MRQMTMAQAINEALAEEMQREPRLILLGEDVGWFGGAFQVTKGLFDQFGEKRVRDTPLSESAIIGCAVGLAMSGWPTVAEIQYSDFVTCGFDQIINQAAKIHLMSAGQYHVPMVLRLPIGAREHGAQHDQCPEAWFAHTPGLKVVIPSNAYDAKGLLKSSIRDPNPVVFCEHKVLYGTRSVGGSGLAPDIEAERRASEGVPEEDYTIPLGEAKIKREGRDVTVVATALMVQRALEAAVELERDGISIEIVDPRTLVPLDKETILKSVRKTGRVLLVTEETRTGACAAEIAAIISEEAFDWLDAPIARLGTYDAPLPFAPEIQKVVIPSTEKISDLCRELISRNIHPQPSLR